MFVDLHPGAPQTGDAVRLDRPLPGQEFFFRKLVTTARFLASDRAAAHCRDNGGLAARDPAFCVRRRQLDISIVSSRCQGFAAYASVHVQASHAVREPLRDTNEISADSAPTRFDVVSSQEYFRAGLKTSVRFVSRTRLYRLTGSIAGEEGRLKKI